MADVPEVSVTAVAVTCIKWKSDAMSLTELDLIFTGLHGPQICHTPWSNDLDVRSESLDAKLETDLVISFTGSTMADSNGTLFTCDFNQLLGNDRTSHGSSEKIGMLVYSTSLYTRHDEIIAELIDDILDI